MTKTVPVRVVEVQTDGGFDWGDAAIGAAAVVAVGAIGVGAFLARRHVLTCLLALTLLIATAGSAQAKQPQNPWGPATAAAVNVPGFQDGCPIESPDGRSLYFASTRPRFVGDLRTDIDIWVAHRDSKDAPWGAPENLGEPVNSTSDDFCPTPDPRRPPVLREPACDPRRHVRNGRHLPHAPESRPGLGGAGAPRV